MNEDSDSSRNRDEALQQLIAAQRMSQVATDRMDAAFCALLGVNRTDGRCLDIVHRHSRMTAGDLGREAGLTSGAVTAALDRLERAGYLQRVGDPKDRRKVLVQPTARVSALAEAVYGQIGRIGQQHMAAMPLIQMDLLTRYLRTGAWINAELAQRLSDEIARHGGESPTVAATAFATRITAEADELSEGLIAAWQGKAPR
jgi:DNA-binding MarR family transcriptional regulator